MIEARPNQPMLDLYEREKAGHASLHSLMVRRDWLRHNSDERAYLTVSALLGMAIAEHPTLFKTLTPRRMAA